MLLKTQLLMHAHIPIVTTQYVFMVSQNMCREIWDWHWNIQFAHLHHSYEVSSIVLWHISHLLSIHVSKPTSQAHHTCFQAAGDHHRTLISHSELIAHACYRPHASPTRPATGIVTVYFLNISINVIFTAVWSKSPLIVYTTKMHMCKIWWEILCGHWV